MLLLLDLRDQTFANQTGFFRDTNSLHLDALDDWTRQRLRIFTFFHPGVFTIIHPPLGFAFRFLAVSFPRGNHQWPLA
jgi:hypothetical protein